MDYQATLYDPIYDVLGVEAVITPDSTVGPVTVTAIDKTGCIPIPSGGIEIETIEPAAVIRMAELLAAGITRDDLEGGTITFNGATWRIKATLPNPSPKGEADGQLLLKLGAS